MNANEVKDKVTALWKSGKKGKGIIIGAVVVVLGIIGSFMDSSAPDAAEGNVSESVKEKVSATAEAAKSSNNSTKSTAKKDKSILNFVPNWRNRTPEYRDLFEKFRDEPIYAGNANAAREAYIETLYKYDFQSPITDDMAKIDPAKSRYSLFGGTLKAGEIIEMPADALIPEIDPRDNSKIFPSSFRITRDGQELEFTVDIGHVKPACFADATQVWRMDYNVKEFMGLSYAKTKWYRAPGSNKLELFYAMVRAEHANSSKAAQEIRTRMAEAMKSKYPEMVNTLKEKNSEEYIYNGDVLSLMQMEQGSTMSMFDMPWVQVGIITPSVVVKILNSLDEQDRKEFEAAKKADSGALDNF